MSEIIKMVGNLDDVIFWQTGRHYSDKGQRIACAKNMDGNYVFLDFDRGIDGVILAIPEEIIPEPKDVMEFIMYRYDHGDYEMTKGNADYQLVRMLGLVCKYHVKAIEI